LSGEITALEIGRTVRLLNNAYIKITRQFNPLLYICYILP